MEHDIDRMNERCAEAHRELMVRLFGEYPEDISSRKISRSRYTEEMQTVQQKYDLQEGHEGFLCWVMYLLGDGKTPQFEEGGSEDDTE